MMSYFMKFTTLQPIHLVMFENVIILNNGHFSFFPIEINETVQVNATELSVVISGLRNYLNYTFSMRAVVLGNGKEIRGPLSLMVHSFIYSKRPYYFCYFLILFISAKISLHLEYECWALHAVLIDRKTNMKAVTVDRNPKAIFIII